MARIIFGVHGTGHGHAVRALSIARKFSQHDFLFISHGTGAEILGREYPVVTLPSTVTVVRRHCVDFWDSTQKNLWLAPQGLMVRRQIQREMDRFQPDVALTDYEFFVPWACRSTHLPCLSIDNQHIITCCQHSIPPPQRLNYYLAYGVVRLLFDLASDFLLTSFYRPCPRPGADITLVPPLLRQTVLDRQPTDGNHVVAYQGYSTFDNFFAFLSKIPRPVLVYGFQSDARQGNLQFKKNSEEEFLTDLANCRYVVCGGNHTLISEALFYGKPVISFPIKNAFEQFLNAFYLQRLGYGRYHAGFHPPNGFIPSFEARLEDFQSIIRKENFCGNGEIFTLVERFIRQGRLKRREGGEGTPSG